MNEEVKIENGEITQESSESQISEEATPSTNDGQVLDYIVPPVESTTSVVDDIATEVVETPKVSGLGTIGHKAILSKDSKELNGRIYTEVVDCDSSVFLLSESELYLIED